MAKKYKATGCARFFFFLVIFIPAVYFGLSYLNDEGHLDRIREKMEDFSDENAVDKVLKEKDNAATGTDTEIQEKIKQLLTVIEHQKERIEEQGNKILEQEKIIEDLRSKSAAAETSVPEPVDSSEATNPGDQDENVSIEELLKEADKAIQSNGGGQ